MSVPKITSAFGMKNELRHIPYNSSPIDNVISSNNSKAQIVLGGDRTSDAASGYSGLGAVDSSAIDIVCGRGKSLSEEEKKISAAVNPDFFNDAARIYISEKADIDDYFKIISKKSLVGRSVSASAIALKADAIRIIGVEGIKLVTRANPTNSKGLEPNVRGIELIAGNDDTHLQSMVKGENLVNCLKDILKIISNTESQITNLNNFVKSFAEDYAKHTHVSSPTGGPTSIAPTGIVMAAKANAKKLKHSLAEQEIEGSISEIKEKFLNVPNHDNNILSKYNKTN